MSGTAAAALAVLAVALALPATAHLGRDAARRPPAPWVTAVLVAATAVLCWQVLDLHDFLLGTIVAASGAGVAGTLRRRRRARAADRRSEQVLAVCEAMASDLAAGQAPLTMLHRAAEEWPDLGPVAVAGQMGADVPEVLRELARRPGAGQLRTVAATWQVAHDTGAGLAMAMHQAAEAIRSDRRTARLVAGELAAAYATARMLAVLPLFVLLLGIGVGGDPVGFLLGTTAGLVVLGCGLALSFAGLSWLERLADRVLRR